ncbi:MAG: alpha/beta hydrolase [Bacteroidales bacterium]|nr:alpha/beta hydrolase [Bacteroidales bacterium]
MYIRCLIVALPLLAAMSLRGQVVVLVEAMPQGTAPDSLFLATDANCWSPCSPAFRLVPDALGRPSLTLPIGPSDTVRFRVCRGRWRAVECRPDGTDAPRRMVVPGTDTVRLRVEAWRDAIPQKQLASTALKSVRFAPRQLEMPQLGKHRSVRVYFPPNYFNGRAFPVIYMHDAQRLFDNATSPSRAEWRVDELMDALYYSRGFSAIVVGIYADEKERTRELTPWPNDSLGIDGQGDAYARFVVKTLKPFVDGHYRSDPRRERTAIIGAELGGLASVYIAQQHPEVFGLVGAIAPAIEPCPKARDFQAKLKPSKRPQRVYLAVGEGQPHRQCTEALHSQMQSAGFADLRLNLCPHGQPEEWYYGEEFERAVRFLFGIRE